MKTCRVAETCAQQLPQVMSPKNLRPSRESKHSGDPYQLYDVQENLETKITKLLSPKKCRNLENLGRPAAPTAYRILKYQRRPTPNRGCMSTIPWKALQSLISKMEGYKRCWLHHCTSRKIRRIPMQCMQEREVSAQYTQTDRKDSLRSHSSEGQKASGETPTHCFHLNRET